MAVSQSRMYGARLKLYTNHAFLALFRMDLAFAHPQALSSPSGLNAAYHYLKMDAAEKALLEALNALRQARDKEEALQLQLREALQRRTEAEEQAAKSRERAAHAEEKAESARRAVRAGPSRVQRPAGRVPRSLTNTDYRDLPCPAGGLLPLTPSGANSPRSSKRSSLEVAPAQLQQLAAARLSALSQLQRVSTDTPPPQQGAQPQQLGEQHQQQEVYAGARVSSEVPSMWGAGSGEDYVQRSNTVTIPKLMAMLTAISLAKPPCSAPGEDDEQCSSSAATQPYLRGSSGGFGLEPAGDCTHQDGSAGAVPGAAYSAGQPNGTPQQYAGFLVGRPPDAEQQAAGQQQQQHNTSGGSSATAIPSVNMPGSTSSALPSDSRAGDSQSTQQQQQQYSTPLASMSSVSTTGPSWSASGQTGGVPPARQAAALSSTSGATGVMGTSLGMARADSSASMYDMAASSVSLVDDDGASGVGLAAAAAVSAAAARAWAVAASKQQQRAQRADALATAAGGNPGGNSGGSEAGGNGHQGRRPGKAGYKLVASVYRDPPVPSRHANRVGTPTARSSQHSLTPPVAPPPHIHSSWDLVAAGAEPQGGSPSHLHRVPDPHLHPYVAPGGGGQAVQVPGQKAGQVHPAPALQSGDSYSSGAAQPGEHPNPGAGSPSQAGGPPGLQHSAHNEQEQVGVSTGRPGHQIPPAIATVSSAALSTPRALSGLMQTSTSIAGGSGSAGDGPGSVSPTPSTARLSDLDYFTEGSIGSQPTHHRPQAGHSREQQDSKQAAHTSKEQQHVEPYLVTQASAPAEVAAVNGQHKSGAKGDNHHQISAGQGDGSNGQGGQHATPTAAGTPAANGHAQQPPSSTANGEGSDVAVTAVVSPSPRKPTGVAGAGELSSPPSPAPMSHALTSPPVVLPPPFLDANPAARALNCFSVRAPERTPGSHISSHAMQSAVSHAVPARLYDQGTAQGFNPAAQLHLASSTGTPPVVAPVSDSMTHAERQAASAALAATTEAVNAACQEHKVQAAHAPEPPPPPAVAACPLPSADSPQDPFASSDSACNACGALAKSTTLTLHWLSPPRTALVVCKLSAAVYPELNRLLRLLKAQGLALYVEPAAFPQVDPELKTAPETLHQVSSSTRNGVTNGSAKAGAASGPVGSANSTQGVNGSTGGSNSSTAGTTHPPVLSSQSSTLSATPSSLAMSPPSSSGGGCSTSACTTCSTAVMTWAETRCSTHSIPDEVARDLDVVVVLGGDGTLLWACSLFGNRPVPPMVPFNMGSLGFLTPFPPSQMEPIIATIVNGGFPMILRHRLHCTIVRAPRPGVQPACGEVLWEDGHSATEKVVLNEVVVDRGISPFLTNLECYCDGNFVTHVQGDGLIVSTPTGSTAYNLAAGGSMVHPQVPGILFTPVCPHSLSFRPLVFPDHVQLCIQVPQGARSQMYCSFDGKDRQELSAGDAVIIRMSQWPIPTVCSRDPSRDWFMGIREGLHWNVRRVQGGAGQ